MSYSTLVRRAHHPSTGSGLPQQGGTRCREHPTLRTRRVRDYHRLALSAVEELALSAVEELALSVVEGSTSGSCAMAS